MVLRNIIKIDEEKCNGCGQCVTACAEGAIELINGKAKLVSEFYCDGLGACLSECPQGAITIEQREAEEFDEKATKEYLAEKSDRPQPQSEQVPAVPEPIVSGGFQCPGTAAKMFERKAAAVTKDGGDVASQLGHWPVQMKLVSPGAPYFKDADLLLVADCVPFAMGDFHNRFLKDHSIVVGCPKLDDSGFYIEKLTQIVKLNRLNSLTVVHMEVPCCSGLTNIAKEAIAGSGVNLSFEDVIIDLRGNVIKTETID